MQRPACVPHAVPHADVPHAAEIQTDRRRVIEYFLSPLLQYATESFRER
jgi:hypothetical protein